VPKCFYLTSIGIVASGVLSVVSAKAQTKEAQSQPSPAYRAEDFMEFVGINGSPIVTNIHEDGPFKGAGRTRRP
jgi:hypothetical protein